MTSRARAAQVPAAGAWAGAGRKIWVGGGAVLLVACVFAVYYPVWRAGFIWDDDAHLTRPDLLSLGGLGRIWAEPGATQQYYPLLHSVFWMLAHLVGRAPAVYHWLNLALHAANALLVWRILGRLEAKGAVLAAALFAVHPVMVESVAWVSELKNTLSGFFYLGAALVYLRYDATRGRGWLAAAFGVFVCALLSKTVTATLPAALLVVLWWRRGRLEWSRDVWPLTPFFAVGVLAGLFTASVESHLIGAAGAEFGLTWMERVLLAGRVSCFYLGKLLWPVELSFIYPRWTMNGAEVGPYLYLGLVLLGLAALWSLRRWKRGPLAAALYFGGTLFPALGFFDVYPFQFSYVADHFQYLASLGVFAWVGATVAEGVALVPQSVARWCRWGIALGLAGLGGLAFAQARLYADAETLYRATLAGNPAAWLADVNLATLRIEQARYGEAIELCAAALRVRPGQPKAHYNRGLAYARLGRLAEAIADFQAALVNDPDYGRAHFNLGTALAIEGRLLEAAGHMRQAVRLMPASALAHRSLGQALSALGRREEAIRELTAALALDPTDQIARQLFEQLNRP